MKQYLIVFCNCNTAQHLRWQAQTSSSVHAPRGSRLMAELSVPATRKVADARIEHHANWLRLVPLSGQRWEEKQHHAGPSGVVLDCRKFQASGPALRSLARGSQWCQGALEPPTTSWWALNEWAGRGPRAQSGGESLPICSRF